MRYGWAVSLRLLSHPAVMAWVQGPCIILLCIPKSCLFIKYSWSIYYVPDPMLGTGDRRVNKTNKVSDFWRLHSTGDQKIELLQVTIISMIKKEAEIGNSRGGPSLGRIIKANLSLRGEIKRWDLKEEKYLCKKCVCICGGGTSQQNKEYVQRLWIRKWCIYIILKGQWVRMEYVRGSWPRMK